MNPENPQTNQAGLSAKQKIKLVFAGIVIAICVFLLVIFLFADFMSIGALSVQNSFLDVIMGILGLLIIHAIPVAVIIWQVKIIKNIKKKH